MMLRRYRLTLDQLRLAANILDAMQRGVWCVAEAIENYCAACDERDEEARVAAQPPYPVENCGSPECPTCNPDNADRATLADMMARACMR